MASQVFRFKLTHSALGVRTISEPLGWKDAVLKLERHPEFNSLVEYFEGSFIFYGENNIDDGGADFIKQVENLYGHDAKLDILIELDIDGDGTYEETVFSGQLDLTTLKEVADNKIRVDITRNDLWSKFIARKETPVNLAATTDLDGVSITPISPVDINLTSQRVLQQYDGNSTSPGSTSEDVNVIVSGTYYQMSWDDVELEEIEEVFVLPQLDNTELPAPVIELTYAGTYDFEIQTVAYDFDPPFNFGVGEDLSDFINFFININGTETQFNVGSLFTSTNIDGGRIYTLSLSDQSLPANSLIRIYGKATDNLTVGGGSYLGEIRWNGRVSGTNMNIDNVLVTGVTTIECFLRITAHTVYPSSEAQGYLLHDAAAAILQADNGNTGVYSEYLGSTVTNARQYDSDGCAWKNIIIQGLQIRGYTLGEKQFSMSFDKWWKGANPVLNLGLGYEVVEGSEVIRIEDIAYFYDHTSTSVNFSNVREISREYDESLLFNRIEIGYNKWQSEDISGLDDPQTKRVWATRLQKASKALTIYSDFIAASIAIEITRRKTIEKNEDYKYDNETFLIAINGDDVSPDRYQPEVDENFNSITGLQDSDTRYNSIHTPLRMLFRWGNIWNICLQKYQTSSLKFVSGEGNYDMVSDYDCAGGDQCIAVICDQLSEKADIPLGAPGLYGSVFGYLFLPLLYTIEIINFTWDEYVLIRDNRRKAIGISQTLDNYKRFFIKELSYDICKGKCKIVAWPFDETPIRIIETVMPDRSENEPDQECESFYVAQFTSDLEGWTSEGGLNIPASTLTGLAGWENANVIPARTWALSSSPDNSLNCCGDVTDIILGAIDTVTGLTYEFFYRIETFGADPTSGTIKFMLLDASNNILDSETVAITSDGVDTGTITLSPVGSNGVNIGVQITNTTAVNSKSYEILEVSLSGGTGASAAVLPSWAWSPNYSGSAKVSILHEEYVVKNFVIDSITVPQEPFTVEIGYVVPTNNSNLSLRFRIYDASNVIIHNEVFASDIADGNEKTATFDITSASVWTDADKFEISVEDTATPEHLESGDEIYITRVEINLCGDYEDVEYDAGYQAILDYADTIC